MVEIGINNVILLAVIFITIIEWWLVCRHFSSFTLKVVLLFAYVFICIYCGCGISLESCNPSYAFFYFAYITIMSCLFRIWIKESKMEKNEYFISSFLQKYGTHIIACYTFLNFIGLIYPEFKLTNLVSPPMPDVNTWLNSVYDEKEHSMLETLRYLCSNTLMPFYYFSLYKYNSDKIKVAGILFFNLYISYCIEGNIGRSSVLVALLIIFLATLRDMPAKKRLTILLRVGIVAPIFLVAFYYYSLIRVGHDVDTTIGISDIVLMLFSQEINYPLWFDDYINGHSYSSLYKYIEWFTLLPFPGFLKGDLGNYRLNAEFTYLVTGMIPGTTGFSIKLPGLVGEGLYVFGPLFFFLHATLYSFIYSKVVIFLSSNKMLSYLAFYYAILMSFDVARGGTISVYPHIVKHLIIFAIVIIWYKKKMKRQLK